MSWGNGVPEREFDRYEHDQTQTEEACNNSESMAQMFVRALPQVRQSESCANACRNKAITRLQGLRLLSAH